MEQLLHQSRNFHKTSVNCVVVRSIMKIMAKVSISKVESVIADPVDVVVHDFRATRLYTERFLNDLDQGLRASSYDKRYAHSTVKI